MSFNSTLQSPVTGTLREYQVIIDFGKYEGLTVSEVASLDPDFYRQLSESKEAFAIKRHHDRTFRLYSTTA